MACDVSAGKRLVLVRMLGCSGMGEKKMKEEGRG